jgi:GR25 family glycosyltransferase involved in LPS biosynthesis
MPFSVHLFQLHSPEHTHREPFLNTTFKILQDKCKYPLKRTLLSTDDPKTLPPDILKTIDYTKIGDEDFDRMSLPLTIQQVSNTKRQLTALKQILAENQKDTLYLVFEDDAIIMPEFQANLEAFLNEAPTTQHDWDLYFLCANAPAPNPDIRDAFKILPSKEAYAIKPAIIPSLLQYFEKMYYTFRIQLSRWLILNPKIRATCPSQRISLEGSKIGFMPSTTAENNVLIYNREFMELFKMVTQQSPPDLATARRLYKSIEHLKSPEMMHLFGVLLFKHEKAFQAKELFLDGVNQMTLQNGLITARSELLNNAINIHAMTQE